MSRRRFSYRDPGPKLPPVVLATVLRESTTDAHKKAEHHPLQQALVRGLVGREAFVRLMCEMWEVQRASQRAVDYLQTLPRTAGLATHMVSREELFRADLAELCAGDGAGPAVDPSKWEATQATRELAAWIDGRITDNDVNALIGLVYVTEGITNSGYYIARAVARALQLPPGEGTRWLNPYGEDVRTHWEAARQLFNALQFTQPEADEAVAGAKHVFGTYEKIFDGLQLTPGT